MPEYLSPGVYVEEISTGPVPIEGVSTSTAGFVGQTARGPTQPTLVTSFIEFQRWFGGFIDPSSKFFSYLPLAAKGFFDNGGQRLFVARVVSNDAVAANLDLGGGSNLILEAIGKGDWGNRLFVRVMPSTLKTGQLVSGSQFSTTTLCPQSRSSIPSIPKSYKTRTGVNPPQ
jgi:phage tail sheath protein FI